MPAGTWYPGDAWPGYKVNNVPTIFTQPVTFQGTATAFGGKVSIGGGIATSGPGLATPGTIQSGGTVTNSLGYDVSVLAAATTGIQSAKIGTYSVPGSAFGGETATYPLYSGNSITLTYTGTLTWLWLAT